jgi:hypothetical protein
MTPLDKTLKRELKIEGRAFVVAVSPEGLKITLKGKRLGQELRWTDLISGDAALATALNASLGEFAKDPPPKRAPPAMKGAPRALKRASPPPARVVKSAGKAKRSR